MVTNLYTGCIVELYDAGGATTVISTHTVTSNTEKDLIISPAHGHTLADGDFIHIRGYGAPCVEKKIQQLKD